MAAVHARARGRLCFRNGLAEVLALMYSVRSVTSIDRSNENGNEIALVTKCEIWHQPRSLLQEVFEIVQFSFSIIRTMKTFKLLHVRYGKTSFVCTLVYQVATGLTITLYAWKSTSGRPTGSAGVAL